MEILDAADLGGEVEAHIDALEDPLSLCPISQVRLNEFDRRV